MLRSRLEDGPYVNQISAVEFKIREDAKTRTQLHDYDLFRCLIYQAGRG